MKRPDPAEARAQPLDGVSSSVFQSFFLGGFECSAHRLPSGRRLDLLQSTRHDEFCDLDYQRLVQQGIRTAREGLRWHLIERTAGQYDFSSAAPLLRAARSHQVQIIWDLFHYGWPDDIDILRPEFVDRFRRMSTAFARWLSQETDAPPFITPINEISFLSWAGGEMGYMNPYRRGRGFEMKAQLVRAAIEGMEAIWAVLPRTRCSIIDPIVHVIPHPNRPEDINAAAVHRASQFEAWEMLRGSLWPQLGGHEKYLDLIGINYYPDNQWIKGFGLINKEHPLYLPFSELIWEVFQRFGRPMFIAETGAEDARRAAWLNYVCEEVCVAMQRGVPIQGICLYPILNHPGWDNDRHCHNGLWDYANDEGEREIYAPLAEELQRQRERYEACQRKKAQTSLSLRKAARAARNSGSSRETRSASPEHAGELAHAPPETSR